MDMFSTNILICFYGSIVIGILAYIALTLRDIYRAVSQDKRGNENA